MPLPGNDQKWPPAELAPILDAYRVYDTWMVGDPSELTKLYGAGGSIRPSQLAGGIIGAVSRFFWGKPETAGESDKRHTPLAADICRVNSDLLFSDPITATVVDEDEKTQERLDTILESAHTVFVGAAELSSGLGGTFLRATWDTTIANHAFVTKVDADLAWPTFRWGRLTAVTFWRVLAEENATVWRHLECHELDGNGIGVIRHGLYEGTKEQLGTRRPYQDRTETAWLASQPLIDGDTISTDTPGLDVVYIRNLEQSLLWRKDALGAHLGRSDLEGLLGDLSDYDEAYTSLMRDLKDGKSRLIVPESMLTSNGPGQGAVFHDRSLFTGVTAAPGAMKDASLPIEQVQFKIRVEEHLRIMEDILHRVIRSAGYSPRSFGLAGPDGAADKTATEVTSEDNMSQQTRKRKVRAWEPELERLLEKCLAIDAVICKGGGKPDAGVDVEFAASNHADPLILAQIVQTLRNARAASTETLVRVANPDADETWVGEEVARILKEDALPPVEDPETFRPPAAELEE
jgi:A118 family predicted phage portal protein